MTIEPPRGIELFAGCGGLSTGFLDAGLHVVAGFELDRRAVDAYEYNHAYRGSRGFVSDLTTSTSQALLAQSGISRVDFLIGGPPCQPFSIAGKRLGAADDRADLLNRFGDFVVELQPSAFLLENVPNLATIDGGLLLRKVLQRMEIAGYAFNAQVVSAADYGVPQNRKRLVIVGIRGASQVDFPSPTYGTVSSPHLTARSALADLPDAGEYGACEIYNHEPTFHSPDMRVRLAALLPGKRERGSFHDRLHPNRPSYTLRAGSGNFSPLRPVHYLYDRVITVRESARIQGFSDNFIWPDRIPRLQQYRQVGNAVPPPLAAAFARSIAEQLGWKLKPKSFAGNPNERPAAMIMTDAERLALRIGRTRGASLGMNNRA